MAAAEDESELDPTSIALSDRKLIAVSDPLLVVNDVDTKKGFTYTPLLLNEHLCYFKSTGTSNSRFEGKYKNTWFPCFGIYGRNHLVKSTLFPSQSKISVNDAERYIRTLCKIDRSLNNPIDRTLHPQEFEDFDTLISYFCSWRQIQISALLSEKDDYWEKHKDIKKFVLMFSISSVGGIIDYVETEFSIKYIPKITTNADFFKDNPEYNYFAKRVELQTAYIKHLDKLSPKTPKDPPSTDDVMKNDPPVISPDIGENPDISAVEPDTSAETRAAAEHIPEHAVKPSKKVNQSRPAGKEKTQRYTTGSVTTPYKPLGQRLNDAVGPPPRRSVRLSGVTNMTTDGVGGSVRRTRRSIRTRRSKRSRRSKRR